jgi:hypothetical protein
MPLDLPLPIADYFVADGQLDGDKIACLEITLQ